MVKADVGFAGYAEDDAKRKQEEGLDCDSDEMKRFHVLCKREREAEVMRA